MRAASEAAWAAGVGGVPTVRVGDALFYGDDQLERAAEAVGRA
jgi:2-hydroxychromene-2-carboxylate isomerase